MSFFRKPDEAASQTPTESKSSADVKSDNPENPILHGISPSCPDVQKAFQETDQNEWVKFSVEAIEDFKKQSFKDFMSAYDFLRIKRMEAAKKFSQGSRYGRWRDPRYSSRENIMMDEHTDQAWKMMRKKCVELVYDLLNKFKEHKDFGKFDVSIETETVDYKKRDDKYCPVADKEHLRATVHTFNFKAPLVDDIAKSSTDTTEIEVREFEDKQHNVIIIYYTSPPGPGSGDWVIGNKYWQELLKWKKEDGIESFLMITGRLSHLMAPLLPCSGGSAAILEWLVRGTAAKKGIELGNFNHDEGISWDFKALLTPDRDEYAKWYSTKAFTYARIPSLEKTQTHQSSPPNPFLP